MGVSSVLAMLIVGAIAGWLAGKIVAGAGFGVLGNIVVGIVGALVAGFVLPRLGFNGPGGTFSSIIHATIGAAIFLALVRLVKKV